uniref:Uncharacterized protein n=1 Tax=Panstrongylus lignarius TaxID=156445 RepID=A0A224XZP9_9HEMI
MRCTIMVHLLRWHYHLSMAHSNLSLSFPSVMRLANPFLMSSTFFFSGFWLLPSIMHHSLSIFEHFLTPKIKEIIGICIKFKTIFAILPVGIQFIQRRWFITKLIRLQHCSRHCISRYNLLIKCNRTFKSFSHMNIL